jgi:hypothetical protein
MEETHPCRRQRRCGATITVGHPLSGGVGSPPYCLTSPTRRRDEELAEVDGGSNGGEARPLLDISHTVARGEPQGDGRRQPWWSSLSPSHLVAQCSAVATKGKKFGATCAREKKLRRAHGE